jgi:hypothetical protein
MIELFGFLVHSINVSTMKQTASLKKIGGQLWVYNFKILEKM